MFFFFFFFLEIVFLVLVLLGIIIRTSAVTNYCDVTVLLSDADWDSTPSTDSQESKKGYLLRKHNQSSSMNVITCQLR